MIIQYFFSKIVSYKKSSYVINVTKRKILIYPLFRFLRIDNNQEEDR